MIYSILTRSPGEYHVIPEKGLHLQRLDAYKANGYREIGRIDTSLNPVSLKRALKTALGK